MNTLCFLSADPSLGRIDKHSLPQETLMDLLIGSFNDAKRIRGSHENPKDVSEWKGVSFDDTNEIVKILWYALDLGGSIELKWLPSSVKEARFMENGLTGTADLTCLPDFSEILSLSRNMLEGTLDLTKLPLEMRSLYLYANNFSGETDFSQLTKSLEFLDVSGTKLEGTVYEFAGRLVIGSSKVNDIRTNREIEWK